MNASRLLYSSKVTNAPKLRIEVTVPTDEFTLFREFGSQWHWRYPCLRRRDVDFLGAQSSETSRGRGQRRSTNRAVHGRHGPAEHGLLVRAVGTLHNPKLGRRSTRRHLCCSTSSSWLARQLAGCSGGLTDLTDVLQIHAPDCFRPAFWLGAREASVPSGRSAEPPLTPLELRCGPLADLLDVVGRMMPAFRTVGGYDLGIVHRAPRKRGSYIGLRWRTTDSPRRRSMWIRLLANAPTKLYNQMLARRPRVSRCQCPIVRPSTPSLRLSGRPRPESMRRRSRCQ